MARNEEKAQAMLNKWLTMKKDLATGDKERRPFLSSDCHTLPEAERWRRQIIKEVSKKVTEIQNAGLGEHRLRDLNDQINKLLREKYHWQRRIKELGGPDYNRIEPRAFDADGRELPGGGGYKYFGAAKDLPGVKELFQKSAPKEMRRTRGDMYKGIDPDYYGYRDEDDGVLLKKEAEVEKIAVAAAVRAFKRPRQEDAKEQQQQQLQEEEEEEGEEEERLLAQSLAAATGTKAGGAAASAATSAAVKAHVPVPRQEDIQAALMEKKKRALMSKYV